MGKHRRRKPRRTFGEWLVDVFTGLGREAEVRKTEA